MERHFRPFWSDFRSFWVTIRKFGHLWTIWEILDHVGVVLTTFWGHFPPLFTDCVPDLSSFSVLLLFLPLQLPFFLFFLSFYRAREKCEEVNKTQKRRCQVCILHPNIFLSLPNLPFLFSFLPPPPVSLRMRVSNSASVFITNGLFPIVRFLNLSRAI